MSLSSVSRESILRDYHSASQRGRPYNWFNYQPINLPGFESTLALAGRNCFDRFCAINQWIEGRFGGRKVRVIDWGCNLGFFAFELAASGHEVVGIDADRRLVEVCQYLAETNDFAVRPRFFCDRLGESAIAGYGQFDAAICLSLLHHLREDRRRVLKAFSEAYPIAFIEMDGRDFGHHELSSFYWRTQRIVECNDRYGSGTRRRLTWFCSNDVNGCRFLNLKKRNIVGGRGVFQKEQAGRLTVVKRESLQASHTWIRTDLRHELKMYQDWSHGRFFVDLLDHGQDANSRWIECEYIAEDGSVNQAELREFFRFLEDSRLFIIDISRDSFLFRGGQLKFVDLESLFPLTGTVNDLLRERTSRSAIPLDTYGKQLQHISRRLPK